MNKKRNEYFCTEVALERNGISLHLDCMKREGMVPERNILLIHGSTFTSHEFDIDYKDYSLARRLVRENYAVWRLDIAGYGRSGEVENGLLPDTEYAAEDIHAAVEKIVQVTGAEKIDVLGWSWGTMTTGRYAGLYPEHLNRLVLYAPILSGLGPQEPFEPFRRITWEAAIEDFQRDETGEVDSEITDPLFVGIWCESCWRYDRESSPRAWLVDAGVDRNIPLIDLDRITVPTLVICGDRDPYLNYDRIYKVLEHLPEHSELKVIPGGAHVVFYEKPHYRQFQDSLLAFLNRGW